MRDLKNSMKMNYVKKKNVFGGKILIYIEILLFIQILNIHIMLNKDNHPRFIYFKNINQKWSFLFLFIFCFYHKIVLFIYVNLFLYIYQIIVFQINE